MVVAVDTRHLSAENSVDLSNFTTEVFIRLANTHGEVQFIFFAGDELKLNTNWPGNILIVALKPNPTNFLFLKWWFDVKLALALKKHKADIFIATNGLASLTTSVKQVLIIRDLAFLQKQAFFHATGSLFHKRYTSSFIKKAKKIITFSSFIAEEVARKYKVDKDRIVTIGGGHDPCYKPIGWEEREAIKQQFAEGWEYFVFTGGLQPRANFWNVLKAFSIFKKWQKTNLKLVVTGSFGRAHDKELEKLRSYKYKSEVILRKGLSEMELRRVIGASYAMICPSFYEGFYYPVLNAMQCEVPVITSANSSMSEICEDAALYVDPAKPEAIAEEMKRIFKDEALRSGLVEAAIQRRDQFTWHKTAALLWGQIEQVVSG